jgi:RimJ/RimL family protein N-acetyltransferase
MTSIARRLESNMIQTSNLQLLPVERRHKAAFLRGKHELAAMLQVTVPDHWPLFPQAFSLPADLVSDEMGELEQPVSDWCAYFFIHPKRGMLVGNGGFKGSPDVQGVVEIGYEIAAEYWNQGFATEAVQAMIDYAFAHPEVQAVMAHTLAEKNASNCVLQKVGMQFVAELDDAEVGKIWCWQIRRPALMELLND